LIVVSGIFICRYCFCFFGDTMVNFVEDFGFCQTMSDIFDELNGLNG
jgi:hypothetical protein